MRERAAVITTGLVSFWRGQCFHGTWHSLERVGIVFFFKRPACFSITHDELFPKCGFVHHCGNGACHLTQGASS